MGRSYYAPINISTVSVAIDVFELLAGTGKPLTLKSIVLNQTTEVKDAEEEMLELLLKQVTGAPTSGSGGGTSTPRPLLPNDVAAGVTLETGNTAKLTGGTSLEHCRRAWNVRTDFVWPNVPVEGEITIADGTRLVLELVGAPADPIGKIVGEILFSELV